jgi:hypothetical protein
MKVFGYQLDSVLRNPRGYLPQEKANLAEGRFPAYYHYISDTLSVGSVVEPVGNSDFKQAAGKWNMLTGSIEAMPYEHPEVKKPRIDVAASPEHGLYATCYLYHDLMTICTLDGELKYNIYGPKWDTEVTNRYMYYAQVHFCGDKIIASYGDGIERKPPGTYATQFLVFDLDGNYLQTLETGYKTISFCHDKENNRLILTLNDEPQAASLNLDER